MREGEEEGLTIWDPLWEFILDDYDDVDEQQARRKRFSMRRRQEEEAQEPGFFDFFLEDDDEYSDFEYEENTISKKTESRENRDDSDDRRNRGFKRSPWRRKPRQESMQAEAEASSRSTRSWDIFPHSGIKREASNKETKRNSRWERRQQKKEDELQNQTSGRDEATEAVDGKKKTQRKGGFFRRFRRNANGTDEERTGNQQSRQVERDETENAPVREKPQQVSQPARRREKRISHETKEESLNPLDMLLEVAEKLDPFASDNDSASFSYVSEVTGRTEDHSLPSSLLPAPVKPAVPQPTSRNMPPEETATTEIRLTHMPIHDDMMDNHQRAVVNRGGSVSDSNSIVQENASQSRAGTIPGSIVEGIDGHEPDNIAQSSSGHVSLQRSDAVVRPVFPSDEATTPGYGAAVPYHDSLLDTDLLNQRQGMQRLACFSLRNRLRNDEISQLKKEDAKQVFPATRMVSDDKAELSAVTGEGADYINGVEGVPSDKFLQTKGPQSLYAYDYETNEHMDVFFAEYGQSAQNSLFVRKLGGPPVLDPSSPGQHVVVQIEASTVSETDCAVRQGDWWGTDAPGRTPGVDFVGKVVNVRQTTAKQYNLQPRETVLSLMKCGGNSRYITIDPAKLVKVPLSVDPAQAACLPETYLTAFQVLHYCQVGAVRYRGNSLRGKSVLIVGSMANNMGKAIIELALHAGVANIYATAKKKHWKTLISFGIMPLSQEPLEWIDRVEGTIDLVLASNGGLREDVTQVHFRALKPKEGQLILCGRRLVGNDIPVGEWGGKQTPLVCAKNRALTKIMNHTHSYDVYEQWERNLEVCKQDLSHLLSLLEQGMIQPTILDRIPLSKVSRAHELLESKRLSGFLVCEPWMRSKKRAVYL